MLRENKKKISPLLTWFTRLASFLTPLLLLFIISQLPLRAPEVFPLHLARQEHLHPFAQKWSGKQWRVPHSFSPKERRNVSVKFLRSIRVKWGALSAPKSSKTWFPSGFHFADISTSEDNRKQTERQERSANKYLMSCVIICSKSLFNLSKP